MIVTNSLKHRCDIKNPEVFPRSVFMCSRDSHNNPVYSPTALRGHSFSWKHIVMCLEARSSSLCARYEEITVFFSELVFSSWSVHIGFVLDTMALRQIVRRVLWFTLSLLFS